MQHVKMIGCASLALAALMAFAGPAPASNLTSPAGTTYTGTIKAESEAGLSITSSFFGTWFCKNSTFEGTVESHGESKAVGIGLNMLTLTECTGGSPTSPVTKRGRFAVTGTTTTGTGTVEWSGAEIIFHNTNVGTCTFTTTNSDLKALTGSNVTGGNATLDIGSKSIPQTGSNPFCPSSAVWEGSYKVTTPATLEVH